MRALPHLYKSVKIDEAVPILPQKMNEVLRAVAHAPPASSAHMGVSCSGCLQQSLANEIEWVAADQNISTFHVHATHLSQVVQMNNQNFVKNVKENSSSCVPQADSNPQM